MTASESASFNVLSSDTSKSLTFSAESFSAPFGSSNWTPTGEDFTYTVSVDNDYAYIKNAVNRVVARVRNVKTTQHNNCADGLTKSGAYNVVYVPDDTGTTISIKVKNISASGRYWYYRGSEQNLFTAYT